MFAYFGLSSLMQHVRTELSYLNSFIKSDRDIVKAIIDDIESRNHVHIIAERLILRYTEKFAEARAYLNKLLLGIQMLNAGKLSSYIVPAERLQKVLYNVTAIVTEHYPSHRLLTDDVAFYFQTANFVYGRQEDTIYISLKLPIVQKKNKDF